MIANLLYFGICVLVVITFFISIAAGGVAGLIFGWLIVVAVSTLLKKMGLLYLFVFYSLTLAFPATCTVKVYRDHIRVRSGFSLSTYLRRADMRFEIEPHAKARWVTKDHQKYFQDSWHVVMRGGTGYQAIASIVGHGLATNFVIAISEGLQARFDEPARAAVQTHGPQTHGPGAIYLRVERRWWRR